jgi:hypothetical protein
MPTERSKRSADAAPAGFGGDGGAVACRREKRLAPFLPATQRIVTRLGLVLERLIARRRTYDPR